MQNILERGYPLKISKYQNIKISLKGGTLSKSVTLDLYAMDQELKHCDIPCRYTAARLDYKQLLPARRRHLFYTESFLKKITFPSCSPPVVLLQSSFSPPSVFLQSSFSHPAVLLQSSSNVFRRLLSGNCQSSHCRFFVSFIVFPIRLSKIHRTIHYLFNYRLYYSSYHSLYYSLCNSLYLSLYFPTHCRRVIVLFNTYYINNYTIHQNIHVIIHCYSLCVRCVRLNKAISGLFTIY